MRTLARSYWRLNLQRKAHDTYQTLPLTHIHMHTTHAYIAQLQL